MGANSGPGISRFSARQPVVTRWVALAALLLAAGCTTSRAPSTQRLVEHQMQLDFSGLKSSQDNNFLRVTSAPPQRWRPLPLQKTALYTHEQWKSPSGNTGTGIVYLHLPIPMNLKMLMWFAKLEYSKASTEGKLMGEWTDELGRPWFEGEDDRYHVRGYAVVDGTDAWFVYFGYKLNRPINTAELGLGARYVQTVVPMLGDRSAAKENLADSGKAKPQSVPG